MIFVGDDWAEDHHDVFVCDGDGKRIASPALQLRGSRGSPAFHDLVAGHVDDPPRWSSGSRPTGACGSRRWSRPAIRCSRSTLERRPAIGNDTSLSGAKSDRCGREDARRAGPHRPSQPPPGRWRQRSGRGGEGPRPGASESDLGSDPQPSLRLRSTAVGVLPCRACRPSDELGRSRRPRRARPKRRHPPRRTSVVAGEDPLRAACRWPSTQHRHPRRRDRRRTSGSTASMHPTGGRRRSRRRRRSSVAMHRRDQHRRSLALETELADHFEQHPDADIYLSLPGIGVILGARVLGEFGDDPNRYADAKSRKNYAATSPVTRASGRTVTSSSPGS